MLHVKVVALEQALKICSQIHGGVRCERAEPLGGVIAFCFPDTCRLANYIFDSPCAPDDILLDTFSIFYRRYSNYSSVRLAPYLLTSQLTPYLFL